MRCKLFFIIVCLSVHNIFGMRRNEGLSNLRLPEYLSDTDSQNADSLNIDDYDPELLELMGGLHFHSSLTTQSSRSESRATHNQSPVTISTIIEDHELASIMPSRSAAALDEEVSPVFVNTPVSGAGLTNNFYRINSPQTSDMVKHQKLSSSSLSRSVSQSGGKSVSFAGEPTLGSVCSDQTTEIYPRKRSFDTVSSLIDEKLNVSQEPQTLGKRSLVCVELTEQALKLHKKETALKGQKRSLQDNDNLENIAKKNRYYDSDCDSDSDL
jgi:hypothetical protein